ncbi:MAG: DevA family ABC transporter ATP-binding protein [Aureliella sp.]
MSATTPPIQGRNLCFAFGQGELRKQILFDVELTVDPGEIVLLTGPSGSGKTTLLTLLGGLRRVQDGELEVLGTPLQGASEETLLELRRRVGFIFQQHNLLPFLTARQNVELVLEMGADLTAKQIVARASSVLRSVGLGERMDYEPASLSGGQRQRVAIARALAGEPKLILADEPTAALDGTSGRNVVEILQKLARDRQIPILMVTHDARVLDIADRVVEMEDGTIIEQRDSVEVAR